VHTRARVPYMHHTYMHTCIMYIHTYMHTSCIYIHIYMHIRARARAHTHTHTHIAELLTFSALKTAGDMHQEKVKTEEWKEGFRHVFTVDIYVSMYTRMHVCIVHVCMYIHTHIYTYR
jgi:hypothetical protein